MEGVLPIIKHFSGCDYHRIVNPCRYMGFDIDSIPKRSTDNLLKDIKLLYFNRSPENEYDKLMFFKRKYGFKLLLDLDDYWELNMTHPLRPYWIENKMGEDIIQWMKVADAVTVTTSRLADKVKQYNKNVYIIPNGLPFDDGQFNTTRNESDFTRFIYTGGDSHLYDVALLRNPLGKVNNLNKAKFILAGYNEKKPKIWNRMEGVFKQAKNYQRIPGQPLDTYMDVYNDSDVCIIPLESNIFTPYKSNIKFLEAGCKNIPVICSFTPPYSDEPNKNIVRYASNAREWLHWFKYYHDNRNAMIDDGLQLGEYVRKFYDLRKVNELRKQLFEYLMN